MLPCAMRESQPGEPCRWRSEKKEHPRCEPEDPEDEREGEERGNRGDDGCREEEEEANECSADEEVEERDEERVSGDGTGLQ